MVFLESTQELEEELTYPVPRTRRNVPLSRELAFFCDWSQHGKKESLTLTY